MNKYIQVTTTIDNRDQAQSLARKLLELRLVGCVQITSCESMYHWQGKIESSHEYLCLMKTRVDLFDDLQQVIEELHPYEIPEILVTSITAANVSYLAWLEKELQKKR